MPRQNEIWKARMADVGELVRARREERGMSRSDLADEASSGRVVIDEEVIRRIEQGRHTCLVPDYVVPIVKALGIARECYLRVLGVEPW